MDLIASGIVKNFGSIQVLDQLDFSLKSGEKTAVIGPSGSGKTTLLSVLSGLEPPDRGMVRIGEQNVYEMSQEEQASFRGRHLAIVFQEFHLINALTALENVSLPLEIQGSKQAREHAKESLDMVGLTNRRKHLPHQLSGGEQQRVAIARALVTKPSVLYADEPTGSLDENTAEDVETLMFQLLERLGVSVFLITHNKKLASKCDNVLELHHGKLNPAA